MPKAVRSYAKERFGSAATQRRAAARRVSAVCVWLAGVALALGLPACGTSSVHSPFSIDAGSEAGSAGAPDSEGGLDVGPDVGDPTLGSPCADDSQCDDGIPCSADRCDVGLERCRHIPDPSSCGNGKYCDGEEVCDLKLGCRAGPPVTCRDADTCTIDTCLEETHTCAYAPRDADGDGDPVWNCAGGGDCDDTDPRVSSHVKEICNNGKDDNCDGRIDEKNDCVTPEHDVCLDALVIKTSGFTSLSLAGAKLDYPNQCAPAGPTLADVVVALVVPDGPAQDIDVVAQSKPARPLLHSLPALPARPAFPSQPVFPSRSSLPAFASLATADSCLKATDVQCAPSVTTNEGALSRLRLYGLAPGAHTLFVTGSAEADVGLSVTYSEASLPPSNQSCDTATELVPGESQTAHLAAAEAHVTSVCGGQAGEEVQTFTLVYTFTLEQAEDVRVFANPLDDFGAPQLLLRDAGCKALRHEPTCWNGSPIASLFARALPRGTYFLAVAASGPSDIDLRLEESSATSPLSDEGCADAPALSAGTTSDLSLEGHADAVDVGCLSGAADSSHSLTLTQASDVLLVERISMDDTGAVSLAEPACTEASRLSCAVSSTSPVRAHAYSVPPGSYRAVAESASGNPVSLTAFTRAAVPAVLVAEADDCRAPYEIPETGGRFKGNTANAHADFSAGCDVPNQRQGAPDQVLHLALKARSRVVLDMGGSSYATMLSVRGGAPCPGKELELACAAGYLTSRSFLDLTLDSGDYYVQVDGYAGDAGAWSLDVYVAPVST